MTENQTTFARTYHEELYKATIEHPDEYGFSLDLVPTVADRMIKAIGGGTFNHDGRAFRNTCKKLNIKYGRKSILDYWNGQ